MARLIFLALVKEFSSNSALKIRECQLVNWINIEILWI